MPHKKIRFIYDSSTGGCKIVPPPRVGVKPDEHVYLVANKQTKVTLKFGPETQMILTPTPPSELVLDAGGGKNASVRYDIVPDAYQRLRLDPNSDTPYDLDFKVDCGVSASTSLRSHDIIMELC